MSVLSGLADCIRTLRSHGIRAPYTLQISEATADQIVATSKQRRDIWPCQFHGCDFSFVGTLHEANTAIEAHTLSKHYVR